MKIKEIIYRGLHFENKMQQECIPIGCIPSTAVTIGERVSAGGVSALGDVCPGGCLHRGCVCPGVYPSMHWGRHPPWTEFLTHAPENITFPQLYCGR